MNTKNFILISLLIFGVLRLQGQTKQDSISRIQPDSTKKIQQVEKKVEIQTIEVPIYK